MAHIQHTYTTNTHVHTTYVHNKHTCTHNICIQPTHLYTQHTYTTNTHVHTTYVHICTHNICIQPTHMHTQHTYTTNIHAHAYNIYVQHTHTTYVYNQHTHHTTTHTHTHTHTPSHTTLTHDAVILDIDFGFKLKWSIKISTPLKWVIYKLTVMIMWLMIMSPHNSYHSFMWHNVDGCITYTYQHALHIQLT